MTYNINCKLFRIVTNALQSPFVLAFYTRDPNCHTLTSCSWIFILLKLPLPGKSHWLLLGPFQVELPLGELTQFHAGRINHFILAASMVSEYTLNN